MITEHRVSHRIGDCAELIDLIKGTLDGNFRMIHISKVPSAHINDGRGIFEVEVLFEVTKQEQPQIDFSKVPGFHKNTSTGDSVP